EHEDRAVHEAALDVDRPACAQCAGDRLALLSDLSELVHRAVTETRTDHERVAELGPSGHVAYSRANVELAVELAPESNRIQELSIEIVQDPHGVLRLRRADVLLHHHPIGLCREESGNAFELSLVLREMA